MICSGMIIFLAIYKHADPSGTASAPRFLGTDVWTLLLPELPLSRPARHNLRAVLLLVAEALAPCSST